MLLVALPSRVPRQRMTRVLTLWTSSPQLLMSTSPSLKVLTPAPLKGATNATIAAAGGNDTVVAALTLSGSSIQSGAGNDSFRFLSLAAALFMQVLVLTPLI